MTNRIIKERTRQICLVGSFNPQIFQPSWLGKKELIRQGEADKAIVKVIHPTVADFRIDWAAFQVTAERFTVTTSDESYDDPLKDLVVGVFKILGETPVRALGVNYCVHFEVEDQNTWHTIGHKIVPKSPVWESVLKNPGTKSVTVQGVHSDGAKGYIQVRLEPSNVYKNGIYVDVNQHFQLGENISDMVSGFDAHTLLQAKWNDCVANGKKMVETLISSL